MKDITRLFASGLMNFSMDEYEGYSVYKQFALQIIKEEVLKFNIRLHGGKVR